MTRTETPLSGTAEWTHPDTDHLLAMVAAVAGVLSLLLLAVDAHARVATAVGLVGLVAGLWGQMVSRTRGERFLDIVGLVASAMAVAVGASYGGLV
jgi:hypothetical protein